MASLFGTFPLLLILFCAALQASAQLPPHISAEIKDMQIELRKADPVGIFTKFSILPFIMPLDLDELEDKKREDSSDDSQTTDLEAMKRAIDKDMKTIKDESDFRLGAIPVLLEIGKGSWRTRSRSTQK